MALHRVLTFDHEGRPVQFDTWLDDLQLYLLSDSKDNVSLFDLASGAATAPLATPNCSTRTQWLTRNAAARIAIRNHLPLAECAHFGQHKTAQALYDAVLARYSSPVVARYSSPATAALGRLLLPYLFPEPSAFTTVEDLVSHLRTSDARYRAAVLAEFLDRNPPLMYITIYFIVTRLSESLRSVRDHFLSLEPTSLTVDLLEQHLLAAETSAFAVGAARGTPRPPFFEGCSPSPLAPSYASATAADVSVPEDVGATSASAKRRNNKGKGGRGGGSGSGGGGGGSESGGGGSSGGGGGSGTVGGSGGSGGGGGGSGGSGGSGGGGTGSGGTGTRRVGSGGGQRQHQQRRSETPSPQQLREWIAIFDLDFYAILSAMYALSVSAEGDCYRCVPPDPGIAAAALGASESRTLLGTTPAEALHTFTWTPGPRAVYFVTAPPSLLFLHLSRSDWLTPPGDRSWPIPLLSSRVRQFRPAHCQVFTSPRSLRTWVESVHTRYRASSGSCVYSGSSVAPPPGSPLPAMPSWHALPPSCLWSSQVPASPAALACPALPSLRRGAAARCSSLLLVSPDDCSLADSPHGRDLPVLRLHSDRGGEFSLNLLRDFCRGEGILQSFMLLDSPQQNGIAERCIGLVMEVARTSMIHAAAPHFLWPFAVRYAAHQLNLWPRVSLPETSPTLRWTGEVGDALVFWVWGSRAFVRSMPADKLSPRAIPYVFLGFVPVAPSWLFYHPTLCRVFPSQDIRFDESDPFYRLFTYRSAPPPPPPLFLAPDPLSGPAPVQLAVDSGAARGTASGGAEPEGAESRGAEPGGVATGGAEPGGIATWGGGAASSGGSAGASPRLSPQQLREWFVRRTRLRSGASGAGGAGTAEAGGPGVAAGAGGPGVAAGAGVTGGTATTGLGGARTQGTRVAGTGGVEGAGVGDLTESGTTGAGGAGAGGAGVGGPCTGGAVVGGPGVGGAGQVLGTPPFAALTPPLLCPPPDKSHPPLHPASPLHAPSPYTEKSGGLTERREPVSRPVSRVCTTHRAPRSRPPLVPGTHAMTLRPSFVFLRVPLPAPLKSSLPEVPDPEFDHARAASPTVSRLLATTATGPSFESTAASALIAELLDFAAACRLDYATALIAESLSASPPSVGGEYALGTNVLEDRQEDFECLAAAVPHFASMVLAPEGDPDALDIPTPRSYAETITGPYSSEWQATMDLHEEIWLRRPPRFTESFPAGTQWSLRRQVYDLRQAPREWHDTLRTTLAALGFAPATADPSLFLRTDTSLPPFYALVYIDDLVFATADAEALTLVKSELQKRHTCTDLGEVRIYLGLQITRDRARRTITLTQSHMVHQVLQRFSFQFSSPQLTSQSTSHSLSAPPSDESVEPSGPYPELVGCLMYLMTCTRPDLAYPLSLLARYVAPDNKAMIALCHEHRLEHRTKHITLRYFLARELQQRGELRLAYVATQANTADVFTKALPLGDHRRFVTVLGLLALLFLTGVVTTYNKGIYPSEWAPAHASSEHLRNSCMATNPVTMSRLLSQLISDKMQQGEKPGPYINRCRNLRDHIKKCDGTVPDDMFVSMVLSGLGHDWRKCQLLLRARATISESALCATLLSEQKEIDVYNEKNNKREILVFFTGATKGEQHGKKGTFWKYCKKPEHTIDRCYKRKAVDERRTNSSSLQLSAPSASPATTTTISPPSVASTSQTNARITVKDKGKGSIMSCMARHRKGFRYYDNIEYPTIAPINPITPSLNNDPTIHYWIDRPTNIPPDFVLPPPTPESPPSISARRYFDLSPYTGDFDRVATPKIAGIVRRNREEYNTWYLDSRCGQHMVGSPRFISTSKNMRRPCEITVANNGRLKAYDIGEICLEAEDTCFTIHIGDVLAVPDLH
ncbi:unnamed protein product [Closterium sp. NIES-53]